MLIDLPHLGKIALSIAGAMHVLCTHVVQCAETDMLSADVRPADRVALTFTPCESASFDGQNGRRGGVKFDLGNGHQPDRVGDNFSCFSRGQAPPDFAAGPRGLSDVPRKNATLMYFVKQWMPRNQPWPSMP